MKTPVHFSGGTKQSDRIPKGLMPGFIDIDEKTDSDYLNFILDFSGILQFWNLQNASEREGTWRHFFQHDLSFLLADIERADLSGLLSDFRLLIDQFKVSPLHNVKEEALVKLLQLSLKLAKQLYHWYQEIQIQAVKDGTYTQIEQMVIGLFKANIWKGAGHLSQCYQGMVFFFGQNPNWIAGENLEVRTNKTQYQLYEVLGESFLNLKNLGLLEPDKKLTFDSYSDFFNFLTELFESLHSTAYLLKKDAIRYLNLSYQQPNHAPQIALLFALQDMMKPSRHLLNEFTRKHLDFYYRRVLLQKPASAIPDQVPVHFQMGSAHVQSFHPKGTTLQAGSDPSGKPIIYKTTKSLTVTQAKPLAFKTLFNGTIDPGNKGTSNNYLLAAPKANSGDGRGGAFPREPHSWPTLGLDEGKPSNMAPAHNKASLGFAFSSPYLLLSGGLRTLSLFFELDHQQIQHVKGQWMQNQGQYLSLELLLKKAFQVAYTSLKGWESPAQVEVFTSFQIAGSEENKDISWDTGTGTETGLETGQEMAYGILFVLTIADDQPPSTAYNPKIHGLGYKAPAPILRFTLVQEVEVTPLHVPGKEKTATLVNPYPLLLNLKFQQIYLKTKVQNVQNFVLQNDFSALSPQSPFAPFGNKPILGSNFYIGNNEIFSKKLSSLVLEIEWYDLPQFPNGFWEYYKMYNLFNPEQPFCNSVFKWRADILIDKIWTPIPLKIDSAMIIPPQTAETGEMHGTGGLDTGVSLGTGTSTPGTGTEGIPKERLKELMLRYLLARKAIPEIRARLQKGNLSSLSDSVKGVNSKAFVANMFEWTLPKQGAHELGSVETPMSSAHGILGTLEHFLGKAEHSGILDNLFKDIFPISGNSGQNRRPLTDAAKAVLSKLGSASDFSNKSLQEIASTLESTGGVSDNLLKELDALIDPPGRSTTPTTTSSGRSPAKRKKFSLGRIFTSILRFIGRFLGILPAKKSGHDTDNLPAQDGGGSSPETGAMPSGDNNSTSGTLPILPLCPKESEGKLNPKSTFQFDLEQIDWGMSLAPSSFSAKRKYSEKSIAGFMKFKLDAPNYAFGNAAYPRILSKVANKNMGVISGKADLTVGAKKEGSAEEKAKKAHKKGWLWKIFDDLGGVLGLFSPLAGIIKKEGDKVEGYLNKAHQLLGQHRQASSDAITSSSALLLPPRPAYIPKIKELKLSYSTFQQFDFKKINNSDDLGAPAFFHLHPFGISTARIATENKMNLLPGYQKEGYLYLGLEKVKPPQELSLMFVLNEGSGNREKAPPQINWSYLDNGDWHDFSALGVQDGTKGFLQSGVIVFDLPITKNHDCTLFIDQIKPDPDKLYWIRATADSAANAVCQTIRVYPHATTAVYAGAIDDTAHLAKPLPAGRINDLQIPHPKISKVIQPVASSGGKEMETESLFYTRVQERLRHKSRAITSWDFEHLVLQEFPSVGLVRCLNHCSISMKSVLLPGATTLIVLPAKLSGNENQLAPKISQSTLKDIKWYLQPKADPFVQLEVHSPQYSFLHVSAELKFEEGLDTGKLLNALNEGLIDAIAPWLKDYQKINPFEVFITYFSLLEYLNQQSYVKEVHRFSITQLSSPTDTAGIVLPESFETIKSAKPWELISSVAKHKLIEVTNLPAFEPISSVELEEKEDESWAHGITGKQTESPSLEAESQGSSREEMETGSDETGQETGVPEETTSPGNALFIRNNWYNNRMP